LKFWEEREGLGPERKEEEEEEEEVQGSTEDRDTDRGEHKRVVGARRRQQSQELLT
jgi:hypothetical protein